MEERLEELRAEYQRGLREMERLDRSRSELRGTLLRISGAIQVLEELLERPATADPAADATADSTVDSAVASAAGAAHAARVVGS